jgi:chaperonin GroES
MSMPGFRPLDGRIVVEPIEEPETTTTGLIKIAKERPSRGTVIAAAEFRYIDGARHPVEVSVGDVVAFGKFAGQKTELLGQDVLIMRVEDLFGVET